MLSVTSSCLRLIQHCQMIAGMRFQSFTSPMDVPPSPDEIFERASHLPLNVALKDAVPPLDFGKHAMRLRQVTGLDRHKDDIMKPVRSLNQKARAIGVRLMVSHHHFLSA
jgi:hypothetical protein